MECFLASKMDSIRIRDEGIIEKADIMFKDGLNIITGKNATGKTTVLRAIAKTGEVRALNGLSLGEKMALCLGGIAGSSLNTCFLLDDVTEGLDSVMVERIMGKLAESEDQIVLTMRDARERLPPGIKANIIDTCSFDLKTT